MRSKRMRTLARAGRRYWYDPDFHGGVSIYQGMAASLLYAVFRAVTGVFYGSAWMISLAVYYFLLGGIRVVLAVSYRRRAPGGGPKSESRCYRRVARLLFLLNIPAGGVILLTVLGFAGGAYPGYLIYAGATYTFYMVTLAVIHLVKYRRVDSPVLSAAQALNFVAALMSLLGLQNAMITQFSGGGAYRRLMNTLTGTAVYLAIIAIAVYMLCHAGKAGEGGRKMNRSESKYFATAARMDEALLRLLEKKDLEYITVKEICAAAEVNRSTFYLHYETVGDLLEECVQYLNHHFFTHMNNTPSNFVSNIATAGEKELYLLTPEYLLPYLNYIKEYRRPFLTAMRNAASLRLGDTYDRMFRHVFSPILERFRVPAADRGYMMAFYIHGLIAVVGEWLKNDCADPVEHIAALMQGCVMSGRNPGKEEN